MNWNYRLIYTHLGCFIFASVARKRRTHKHQVTFEQRQKVIITATSGRSHLHISSIRIPLIPPISAICPDPPSYPHPHPHPRPHSHSPHVQHMEHVVRSHSHRYSRHSRRRLCRHVFCLFRHFVYDSFLFLPSYLVFV